MTNLITARIRVAVVAACAAAVTACGFHAPPVRVQGTASMLEQLAGEWWGEYTGDRLHGRNGSIAFKLVAGEDHAHGDVLMTPRGADRPYGRGPGEGASSPMGASNVLTIRFVTAIDGTITGALDPYWDPERGTEATATFRGRVSGDDTIEGTFITAYADGQPSTGGRWKATRKVGGRPALDAAAKDRDP